MLDIQEVKEFFMEASINTYAGSAVRKSTIKELPESKVFHYERGNFLYEDCYFLRGRVYWRARSIAFYK